jgi:hypothetical protein
MIGQVKIALKKDAIEIVTIVVNALMANVIVDLDLKVNYVKIKLVLWIAQEKVHASTANVYVIKDLMGKNANMKIALMNAQVMVSAIKVNAIASLVGMD